MPNNWVEPLTPPYGTDANGNRITPNTGIPDPWGGGGNQTPLFGSGGGANINWGAPATFNYPYQAQQPSIWQQRNQPNGTFGIPQNVQAPQRPPIFGQQFSGVPRTMTSVWGDRQQPKGSFGSPSGPNVPVTQKFGTPQQNWYAKAKYDANIKSASAVQNTEKRFSQYNYAKSNIPPGSVGNVGYNKYAEALKQKYNLGPGQKYQQFIKNGAIYAKNSADMKTLWQNYTALDNWPKAPQPLAQTGGYGGGYPYYYGGGGGGGYKKQAQPLESVVWRTNQ